MSTPDFRRSIIQFVRANALPPDKFEHQPRLYALARELGQAHPHDDDVLFAAAWLHDLGVFIGHRPEDLAQLAAWDHIAYAQREVPKLLAQFGFPTHKIPAVNQTIRTHMPSGQPTAIEGILLRDADILEQLGAIGILRAVSKVGRDTRFPTHDHAVQFLARSARDLPAQLQLPLAKQLAEPRLAAMRAFLDAVSQESRAV